jgi:hypothetical protein
MSSFKTVLVRDSVIGDITSDIDYAVKSGASQCTFQQFPSTSASNSALIFNVQVPSENTIIGRDMMINTGLTFRLGITGVPALAVAWSYGATDALHAFPLNSLFSTATAQINNTTVSINTQDVLPALLRMNNSRELYRFNSTTPSLPDQAYGLYSQAVGAANNPLGEYGDASYDVDQVPRGAFPISYTVVHNITAGGTDASLVSTNVLDTWVITISTVVSEPLILSPFIFGDPEYNQQGFLGINNMTFTLNIDSTCKRLFSSATAYPTTIQLGSVADANGFKYQPQAVGSILAPVGGTSPQLLLKLLSSQPSDLIQSKNIVPYMDFPRYLTTSALASPLAAGASNTLTSSNLQINQIPDLFIINIRKPMSSQTIKDADAFFKVNNISINLNNQSGLLSSATAYDLWRMSVKNGSTQSWAEFSGQASNVDAASGALTNVATTGSLLIISPAYDLSLPDYLTCGSLGNYNFQFTVGVTNQFLTSISPELIVITANSGIFTTQQGVSSIYTGILTKEMVLDAKSKQQASAMKSAEVRRMTGGSLWNALSGVVRKVLPYAQRVAADPDVQKFAASKAKGLLGLGTSGGAMRYC